MSEVRLTPQQEIAATASGNALLVSAAAGSGKTMVLVQRIMRMICDDKINADVTDFLIITYTRAATAELRGRIMQELRRRISEKPLDKRLRRQEILCMKAHISTIHSFCTEIIRENAHLIDMSPDFRVAEEAESELLKTEVLERVLDEKYENIQNDAEFKAFADLLMETRGDRKLSDAVLDAYKKLQSHPDPDLWMKNSEEQLVLSGITDVSETIWGREVINHAKTIADHCIKTMSAAFDEMQEFPDMLKAYGDSFITTISSLKAFRGALDIGWDAALEHKDILFPTARISGYEYFKKIRKKCKDTIEKETAVFDGSSSELLDDMRHVALEAKGLYSTLRDFDKAYKAEKLKRGIIDFTDQEHLALRLLYDFENNCPSELACDVAARYREILVDEYQDVNAVQELIFTSVSKEQKNMFMVGDVKQSIYRFRMADPTIFLEKYLSFDDYAPENDSPQKVLLPANFRSRPDILNAVNYIFKNLMSVQFGEMDYTEKEFLKPGAEFPETDESCLEYDIVEVSDDEEELSTAEAEFVAERINEIVKSGMLIPDGGSVRPVTYSDFAILLRSLKGRAWKFAFALDKYGIPADIPTADDFFESYEVSTMMSLLAVIDNPHQDIPLITTLRSPVFNFSLDDLAKIRAGARSTDLFDAVVRCSAKNEKCRYFLEELDYFRESAAEMSADKLIWHIYNRTGIVELLCASEGGQDRQDNLVLLAELARRFEANGFKGLFRFLNQLRGMMENDKQPVSADTGSGNGVKIMSIHKSKGLEFPVVILADTTHRFNLQDTTKPVLFHSELGIGLYRRNNEKRYKYPTLARRAVSRRITLETLSEELRVLYVALTRAKHKLIMVSTVKNAEKEFEKYWPSGEYPAAPSVLESIHNYEGWLMKTMLTRPESNAVYKPDEAVYAHPTDTPWDIRKVVYTHKETDKTESAASEIVLSDGEAYEKIKRNMEFRYAFDESTEIPSKLTATELKGRNTDAEIADGASIMAKTKIKLRKPDFAKADKPITGSEKGTALHYVMQFIDYSKCKNTADVESELIRLVEKRFITKQQAQAVSPEKIVSFFRSPLGSQLLNSKQIVREFKFSILVPAKELLKTDSADKILFQGVIDCYFEDEQGLTVIDFKTDRITDGNYEDKISTYSTQIRSYAMALERITGKPVINAVLYFFDLDKPVKII